MLIFNRIYDKVVILGSGMSILELTENEIDYINKCKKVVALNKFAAFYKKSGIIPTHIYFHDFFGLEMFKYVLQVLDKDNLKGISIYTNPFFHNLILTKKSHLLIRLFKDIFVFRLKSLLILTMTLFKKNKFLEKTILFRNFNFINISGIKKIKSFVVKENPNNMIWAKSFNQEIFHFRGSLSSVLNIISIENSGCDIILIGNDFYGTEYFYEKELNELGDFWKDFTYDLVKKNGLHYSFQKVNNLTISDGFLFINKNLNESFNKIFCNNKESLLVKENCVKYISIIDFICNG